MIFKDIQAIFIPELTIITKDLYKPRISKGEGTFKIEPLKKIKIQTNHLGIFKRAGCVENFTEIQAF